MPLTSEDLRFACDDARKRQTAVVELIVANDRQAMALLQIYLAIASGALSAAAAVYYNTSTLHVPKVFFAVLVGISLPMIVGIFCCILGMWPTSIRLPGREASFWVWAVEHETSPEAAYRSYLDSLAKTQAENKNLNARASAWVERAKRCGAVAPFIALLALLIGITAHL
jgi:hypothetical protein